MPPGAALLTSLIVGAFSSVIVIAGRPGDTAAPLAVTALVAERRKDTASVFVLTMVCTRTTLV